MTNTTRQDARRRRALAVALAVGAALVPIVANAAATVPDEPAGVPIALAESTFTFGDGPYHWASTHGSVLDVDGEVILDEGTVTFLATTSGTLLVPQDGSDPFELTAGSAIPRDEALATTVSVPLGEPAGYVAIDIQGGDAATDVTADTTVAAETSAAGGDVAATPPSFAPGAGARTVTLHRVVVDPERVVRRGIDRARIRLRRRHEGRLRHRFRRDALHVRHPCASGRRGAHEPVRVRRRRDPRRHRHRSARDARRRVSCRRGHTICAP